MTRGEMVGWALVVACVAGAVLLVRAAMRADLADWSGWLPEDEPTEEVAS